MSKCKYVLAWVGPCGGKADDGEFCEAHAAVKCAVCKEQATHECSHTGQFVCGAPLCDGCEGFTDQSQPSGNWGFLNHRHRLASVRCEDPRPESEVRG